MGVKKALRRFILGDLNYLEDRLPEVGGYVGSPLWSRMTPYEQLLYVAGVADAARTLAALSRAHGPVRAMVIAERAAFETDHVGTLGDIRRMIDREVLDRLYTPPAFILLSALARYVPDGDRTEGVVTETTQERRDEG